MADRETNCSFCGRKKSEVDILIAGVTGHICDHCINRPRPSFKRNGVRGRSPTSDSIALQTSSVFSMNM